MTISPGFRLEVCTLAKQNRTLSDASVSDLMIVATDAPVTQSILAGFATTGSANPTPSVLRIAEKAVTVAGNLFCPGFSNVAGVLYGSTLIANTLSNCHLDNCTTNDLTTKYVTIQGSNVGVGNCNPQFTLDVKGDLHVTGNLLTGGLRMSRNFGSNSYQIGGTGTGTGYGKSPWVTGIGTGAVYVLSSNVGIGTSNPLYPLDVVGNIRASGSIIASGFRLANGGVYASNLVGASLSQCTVPYSSLTGSPWSFTTYGDTVLNNGYVGIGTKDPLYPLDVVGSLRASGSIIASGCKLANGGVYASNLVGATLSQCTVPYSSMTGSPWTFTTYGDTVLPNGYVGIGMSNPLYPLDVVGNIRASGSIIASGFRLANGGMYASNLVGATLSQCTVPYSSITGGPWITTAAGDTVLSNGNHNLGIGTMMPSYALDVVGTIRASGGFSAFSDARHKTNLQVIPDALRKVNDMTGYTFKFRDDEKNKREVGLLAQEVKKVLPELVQGDDDIGYSIAYGNMTAVLIEAIKTLDSRINLLEERVH